MTDLTLFVIDAKSTGPAKFFLLMMVWVYISGWLEWRRG